LDSRHCLGYNSLIDGYSLMTVVRRTLLLLLLGGVLAACGVRGDPELPPGADPDKNRNRPIVLDKLI
jgi:predicted small lipoprotein YifL